jgi:hypothetical protein
MATSGSWDYSRSALQIISAAFEDLGVLIPGGTVASADSALALVRLNHLVKQWQGDADGFPGLHLVHRQRVTLFLAKGQQTYLIGPASTNARATTLYGRTTIDAAEAAGQTVISVTATSDTTTTPGTTSTATASDFIGIEQDDGTIHWSTVSSISAGDTITIGDALASAAAVGNYVWWFTSRAQRFPAIESAVLRDENYTDTPLTVYTDVREYEEGVSDKYADGDPTCILVEPLRITTRVTLDAQPTDVTKTIVLTVQYPAEDYDDTANDIAFPQEYLAALEWELAFRLAPAYGSVWTPVMEANRQNALSTARRLNPENSVLYFQPGGY